MIHHDMMPSWTMRLAHNEARTQGVTLTAVCAVKLLPVFFIITPSPSMTYIPCHKTLPSSPCIYIYL